MVKILLPIITVVILLGSWFLFSGGNEITNYPSDGTTIVAFGDSLIEGVGATAGNDLISQLERGISQPIINLGVSGDTTANGLSRVDVVIEQDPKVVILLLGGNDAIQNVSLETTLANLDAIITQIHEAGAVVVLLGVRGGILGDSYKSMYEDLAEVHGTLYVSDVLSGVFGRPNLMSDPIHPNNEGYRKIYERVLPVLESAL